MKIKTPSLVALSFLSFAFVMLITLTFVVLGLLFTSSTASAALRCDCAQQVGACSAKVAMNGMQVEIESSSSACSKVDYLINGQPYTALVVGGETDFKWNGQPQSSPNIVVENCRVCADAKTGNAPAGGGERSSGYDTILSADDADTGKGPRALIKVMPDYPRTAFTYGSEGTATVEFNINSDGQVENIRVIDSSNSAFATASIDAVSRFRYEPKAQKGVREEFTFSLSEEAQPVVSSRTL